MPGAPPNLKFVSGINTKLDASIVSVFGLKSPSSSSRGVSLSGSTVAPNTSTDLINPSRSIACSTSTGTSGIMQQFL